MTILQIILTAFIFKLSSANANDDEELPNLSGIQFMCEDPAGHDAAEYFGGVQKYFTDKPDVEEVTLKDGKLEGDEMVHLNNWQMMCNITTRADCLDAVEMIKEKINKILWNGLEDSDPEAFDKALESLNKARTIFKSASLRYLNECDECRDICEPCDTCRAGN